MPEAVVDPTVTTPESLGWRAGLPDDLKQNADIATYKTVGDFTKDALQWKGKVGELEVKLASSVPKLPDDATDEDRATYYTALGRPSKANEYELDGEDKNAPEWTNYWKETLHGLGLTKDQAKQLSGAFNKQIQGMVDAANTAHKAEMESAEKEFRTEMGDKYDTNVELAKRFAKDKLGDKFDSRFDKLDANGKQMVIELTLKYAALTGEDTSPQGGHDSKVAPKPEAAWMEMYKSPKPGVSSGRR